MTKNQENQKELENAVKDFRNIKETYEASSDCSQVLTGRFKILETELLNEHFDLIAGSAGKGKPKKPAEPFRKSLQPETQ